MVVLNKMEDVIFYKKCLVCSNPKPEIEFSIHHYTESGVPLYRNQCDTCRQKITYDSFMKRRRADVMIKNKDNLRKRSERKNPKKRARFIVEDSKRSDKKKNRDNNLTIEFVKNIIVNGCSYCEEKKINICLDRIDNSKGHTTDNVIAACVRCNYIRNSMPYEAWLCMVPSIKEARIGGLFDNWKTRFW